MHSIFDKRRGPGLYALAWIPLAVLLGYLLHATGISIGQTLLLVVPLAPICALLCLGAGYPCKATPIPRTGLLRLGTTHISAAALISSVWVFIAAVYAAAAEKLDSVLSAAVAQSAHFSGLASHAGLYKTIFGIGMMFYLLSAALQYMLLAQQQSRKAEQREAEAKLLARDAELRALKAQINPHFLFNSLHSISALTTVDAKRAREMCISLADFLRKTLGLGEKALIPLSEELALLRSFITVEKIRFGPQLQFAERIEEGALDCLVPPLFLQPLIENAVTHGVANLPEGGAITIAASCDAGRLKVAIENDFDPDYKPKRGNGIGIANVHDRLAARYGKDATFDGSISGGCYVVRLTLPAEHNPCELS